MAYEGQVLRNSYEELNQICEEQYEYILKQDDRIKELEAKLAEVNQQGQMWKDEMLASHDTGISSALRIVELQEKLAEAEKLNKHLQNLNDTQYERLTIATEKLSEIREMDWGTDHCDAKNMIADEALAKLKGGV
jgi:tRNA U55 pseudouridine synthase TruB